MGIKKGVNLCTYSDHRGTAKHPNATEIARGTHPLGALTKTISLHFKKLAVFYKRNISNAIF
jgi:hypothetical protein